MREAWQGAAHYGKQDLSLSAWKTPCYLPVNFAASLFRNGTKFVASLLTACR
jgi:hypothetical protein